MNANSPFFSELPNVFQPQGLKDTNRKISKQNKLNPFKPRDIFSETLLRDLSCFLFFYVSQRSMRTIIKSMGSLFKTNEELARLLLQGPQSLWAQDQPTPCGTGRRVPRGWLGEHDGDRPPPHAPSRLGHVCSDLKEQ